MPTQHKPQRDTAKAKELSDLKRENRSLKKQLARARKQLLKVMEIHNQQESETQDSLGTQVPASNGCESCGSQNLAEVLVPSGKLTVCKDCKHRKVKKNE